MESNGVVAESEAVGIRPSGMEGALWPVSALEFPYSFGLFGRFAARCQAGPWPEMQVRRLQQILSYLLLSGDVTHHREDLAAALWPDTAPKKSRKNLRQNLWNLQRVQAKQQGEPVPLFKVEKNWVKVNWSCVWSDVVELERTLERVSGIGPERLDGEDAAALTGAVNLYRGNLLEGWDDQWCVQERERLRGVYLALLEKLVGYCEAAKLLEAGFAYSEMLLAHDRANERAHWRVMRLHQLAGDRTQALRQFEKCRAALNEELGVGPGRLTRTLYEEICSSG